MAAQPQEVAPGIWRAGSRYVNWYVVDAGDDGVTLVDTGLPGYRRRLGPALARVGRTVADVRAVVLTHGHIDHVGCADAAAADGAPVFLHSADSTLARDPSSNRTDRPLLPYLRWPATAAFVVHCVRQGATRPRPMPATQPLADGAVLDVPGRPRVVHTPGHTAGSCVLDFAEHDTVFVGDLLCTASPVTGRPTNPELQSRASNRDSEQALASLARLRGVESRLVLPGHGGPWRDGVESAVASARDRGCR